MVDSGSGGSSEPFRQGYCRLSHDWQSSPTEQGRGFGEGWAGDEAEVLPRASVSMDSGRMAVGSGLYDGICPCASASLTFRYVPSGAIFKWLKHSGGLPGQLCKQCSPTMADIMHGPTLQWEPVACPRLLAQSRRCHLMTAHKGATASASPAMLSHACSMCSSTCHKAWD